MNFETLNLLLKKYGNIKKIYNLNQNELNSNSFLSRKQISELSNIFLKKDLKKYTTYMNKNKIEIVTYENEKYPQKLNNIENKPIVLYMKGNISNINNESVAIVGSRECSDYGKKNAYFFSYELAKRNVNIISGMAKGIDTSAHIAAMKANGKTIAVIGSGIDIIYPKENEKIFNYILQNDGLIISEHIVGTKPNKENFPKRNRIISGISDAVIVVEASEKSGSLITADYAINQGKDVWAIPGNINSYNSMGTNNLIKDGALVLTRLSDIVN